MSNDEKVAYIEATVERDGDEYRVVIKCTGLEPLRGPKRSTQEAAVKDAQFLGRHIQRLVEQNGMRMMVSRRDSWGPEDGS